MAPSFGKSRSRRGRILSALPLFAVLLVCFYFLASSLILSVAIRPGRKAHDRTPAMDGLQAEELHFSNSEGLNLFGYLLGGKRDKGIVLVHGLDSNCWRGFYPELTAAYLEHGFSVLVFDLRGHGDSEGDELGMSWKEREDVRAAVGLLIERGFAPGSIGLHGSSYGAATVLNAAAVIPEVAAVVADSPFADFRDLLEAELKRRVGSGALFRPGILLLTRWQHGIEPAEITPLKAVPKIAPRPILFIHGLEDSRIPAEHTRRLVAASSNPNNEVWLVPGAGHTQAFRQNKEEFLKRVFAFWDRWLG